MNCFNKECVSFHEQHRDNCTIRDQTRLCELFKPLIAEKADGSKVPCSDGLSVLLQDAKVQRRWFEESIKEEGISGEAEHYRRGSRDAYGYMVSAIIEAINR